MSERQRVTYKIIAMLGIKFDSPQNPNQPSPQEIAISEFGAFIRAYHLTGEELIEAYRMALRKELGEEIKIFPTLSIIQAGEIIHAYQEFKRHSREAQRGREELHKLLNPPPTISQEQKKATREGLLAQIKTEIENGEYSQRCFPFYNELKEQGIFESFLSDKGRQNSALNEKTKEILAKEKRKEKNLLFSRKTLKDIEEYLENPTSTPPYDYKFIYQRAIVGVKNDLVYHYFKEKFNPNNNQKQ